MERWRDGEMERWRDGRFERIPLETEPFTYFHSDRKCENRLDQRGDGLGFKQKRLYSCQDEG
jgi:hypothetical protein